MKKQSQNNTIDYIREANQIQAENIAKRPRFGMFTCAPPLCLNDPYSDKPFRYRGPSVGSSKDLEKKNISICNPKKGNYNDIYFSVPSYNSIGDTYQDPFKLAKYNYHNGNTSRPKTITAWKHTDVNKTSIKAPYDYVEEPNKSDANLTIFHSLDDKSKEIGKKRFSSSVGKRGKEFNRPAEYMTNPYDIDKDINRDQMLKTQSKIMHGPF